MGHQTAISLKESITDGLASIDQALLIHLLSNHYPPLPSILVDTCKQVITAIQDGEFDKLIDLPGRITWRGQSQAPARECCDAWHLDAFIDQD
jgi:hypothetical protein